MCCVMYLLFALSRVLGIAQTKISSDIICFIDPPTGAESDWKKHGGLCKQKQYVHPLRSALFNNAVNYRYHTASVIYDWKVLKFTGMLLREQNKGLGNSDLGSKPDLRNERLYQSATCLSQNRGIHYPIATPQILLQIQNLFIVSYQLLLNLID